MTRTRPSATRRAWSLAGSWELRPTDGSGPARRVTVPACWEDAGIPKDVPGPFTYRRSIRIPALAGSSRLWLRFGAVSYACRVMVGGREVGSHVGAWDAFAVDITDAVGDSRTAVVEVEVEKPASLTAGPDSPAVPGHHPLRETLSGFLPYVWGHMFGGIWQEVTLVTTGQVVIEDAHVTGDPDGWVAIDAALSAPSGLEVVVRDPDGRVIEHIRCEAATHHQLRLLVPSPRAWSPDDPARFSVDLRVPDGDERTIRFGLRRVGTDGTRITLNGAPVFPRMILSWGWYPERLTPTPDPARVRADLERLRELGFNGVKLCLWVPPQAYLDICDQLGMLVWLELPMWLPRPSAAFRSQLGPEYERIVRATRGHPSVVMYTLGCELNTDVGDLLGPLYQRVKALVGDALVRDNSGSGEAYGGRLDEAADFHDHHPYAELHHLPELLDHFAPRWRPRQPWLFGEFADSDAFRDPRTIVDEQGEAPWWLSDDPSRNPQGARWTMDVTGFAATLGDAAEGHPGEVLRDLSEQASLLHRRRTIETVRSRADVSGYVVTGERDTPISTSGMWDDTGRLRVSAPTFRHSNADLVITLGWDRRRAWVSGGDRPAPSDPWTHRAGEEVRTYLVLSHFGRGHGPARVTWRVVVEGRRDRVVAQGVSEGRDPIAPGDVREVAVVRFVAPPVSTPTALQLFAEVGIGDETAANDWPMWVFPEPFTARPVRVAIIDPAGHLTDLREMLGDRVTGPADATVAVASRWTDEARDLVEGGRGLVLLQPDADGPLEVEALPYWREAIRIAEPHAAWGDFPTRPFLGLQVAALAADHAFVPTVGGSPIMRRLDARTGRTHDYAVESSRGEGRMIATTLRLWGGVGDLPRGLSRSPGALHLLEGWLRHLVG